MPSRGPAPSQSRPAGHVTALTSAIWPDERRTETLRTLDSGPLRSAGVLASGWRADLATTARPAVRVHLAHREQGPAPGPGARRAPRIGS